MKAVIFDMDGVIFDGESVWKKAHKATNKKFNVHVSEKIRTQLCGRNETTCRTILKNLYPNLDVDAYRDYMNNFVDKNVNSGNVSLKSKNIEDLIYKLKSAGFHTALATGSKKRRTEKTFENAGLDINQLFDSLVTGDDVKNGKPDPEIYLSICKKLKISPKNCFALEDSPNGIKSAFSAGCHAIMVVDLIKPNKEIKTICDKIFKNLDNAVQYIIQNFEEY